KHHFNVVQKRAGTTADLDAAEARMKKLAEERKDALEKPEADRTDEDKKAIEKLNGDVAALEPKLKALRDAKGAQERILALRDKQVKEGLNRDEQKELKG